MSDPGEGQAGPGAERWRVCCDKDDCEHGQDEVADLRAALRASEAALAESRKKEREACASHGCNRCRLLLADPEAR